MKKFLEKIMPFDKLQHAFVGSIMCLVYLPIILFGLSPFIAFGICLAIAIGNEIVQKVTKNGEPSVRDVLATIISPLITLIITLIQF